MLLLSDVRTIYTVGEKVKVRNVVFSHFSAIELGWRGLRLVSAWFLPRRHSYEVSSSTFTGLYCSSDYEVLLVL